MRYKTVKFRAWECNGVGMFSSAGEGHIVCFHANINEERLRQHSFSHLLKWTAETPIFMPCHKAKTALFS